MPAQPGHQGISLGYMGPLLGSELAVKEAPRRAPSSSKKEQERPHAGRGT